MKAPAHGHSAKHSHRHKHRHHLHHHKHHPHHKPVHAQAAGGGGKAHVVAKHPKHPKPRGLPLAQMVACCAAEALAASLRLAGCPVSDQDVLKLYWHTASHPDAGASILATLQAAQQYGLAGTRPRIWGVVSGGDANDLISPDHAVCQYHGEDFPRCQESRRTCSECDGQADHFFGGHSAAPAFRAAHRLANPRAEAERAHPLGQILLANADASASGPDVPGQHVAVSGSHAANSCTTHLILGMDLPGPHTVAVGTDGCWLSWGGHYDPAEFPAAVIEEAWAVTW